MGQLGSQWYSPFSRRPVVFELPLRAGEEDLGGRGPGALVGAQSEVLSDSAAHCKTGGANLLPGVMYIVVGKIEEKCMIFIWLDLGR